MGRPKIKAIGVYLAQVILTVTGNPALAATLKLLPKVVKFPVRTVVGSNGSHLEFLTSESEWDQWAAEFRRSSGSYPANQQSAVQ
jgi:hypothetical protein